MANGNIFIILLIIIAAIFFFQLSGNGGDGNGGDNGGGDSSAVITILDSSIARMAPHTIHVNAISSVNMIPWEKSIFLWDFDNSNNEAQHLTTLDPRNGNSIDVAKKQAGFNAAYIYTQPGTYNIKLTAINKNGVISTTTKEITILPDTRTKKYIDSVDGSDSNDGTTPETAWKTLGYAWTKLTNETSLLFKRGQIHEVNSNNAIGPKNNIYIGAYGSGNKPILKWTGNNTGVAIFTINTASENTFIENIYFDTIYEMSLDSVLGSKIDALEVKGKSTTLANSEFGPFSTIVDMGSKPEGIFIFNDKGGRTRRFGFFTTRAKSLVIIGADFMASLDESVIRLLPDSNKNPNSLVNIEWTHFDQEEKIKSAFRYQAVQFGHMYQSRMSGGADKISQDDGDSDYIVLDGVLRDTKSELHIGRNANNIMIRNSVFDYHGTAEIISAGSGAGTDCKTQGHLSIEQVSFVNNLFRVEDTGEKLPKIISMTYAEGNTIGCVYDTTLGGITISNNLFMLPQRYEDSEKPFISLNCGKWNKGGGTIPLPCEDIILTKQDYLEDLVDFSGNVFSTLSDTKIYIQLGSDSFDWNETNAIPSASNLARESIAYSDVNFPLYKPSTTTYPITTTNAKPVEGIIYDYFGNKREGNIWSAGAVM